MTLTLILLASAVGGLVSVLLAALVAWGVVKPRLDTWLAFAVGALLAAALFGMIPEALERGLDPQALGGWLAVGLGGFFLLDKFARARQPHDAPLRAAVPIIVVGDGLHNFVDGVLIAAAFLADPVLGWAATLAVVAHEVPQEAGDFAILLAAGWQRAKALFWNGVSSLASLVGGVLGYLALERAQEWVPYILTITAASFTYIAIADLMPRLKREQRGIGWHGLLLAAGLAIVVFGSGHAH